MFEANFLKNSYIFKQPEPQSCLSASIEFLFNWVACATMPIAIVCVLAWVVGRGKANEVESRLKSVVADAYLLVADTASPKPTDTADLQIDPNEAVAEAVTDVLIDAVATKNIPAVNIVISESRNNICKARKSNKSKCSRKTSVPEAYAVELFVKTEETAQKGSDSEVNGVLDPAERNIADRESFAAPSKSSPKKGAIRIFITLDEVASTTGGRMRKAITYKKAKSAHTRQFVKRNPSVNMIRSLQLKKAISCKSESYKNVEENVESSTEVQVKRLDARKYKYSPIVVTSKGSKIPIPINSISEG